LNKGPVHQRIVCPEKGKVHQRETKIHSNKHDTINNDSVT